MIYTKPEDVGIPSKNIIEYIKILEEHRLSTHNLILARGDCIFFEHYWEPFNKKFLHRMYSASKNFVSLAIGFLEQDGLISLDDKISMYFKNEIRNQTDENMKKQTIRHMLMMATAKHGQNWFKAKPRDRVQHYFDNDLKYSRYPGLIYEYDSTGSFVLCALVERLTKMPFMEYLREKLFNKIGVSKEAYCLKCPGGHSWGDSGVMCTPSDLLKVARFVMNCGRWNGEQILNSGYLRKATSKQIDNSLTGFPGYDTMGYGYQFRLIYGNAYYFSGLGCQLAVCVPEEDLIMVYNGDNQGNDAIAKKLIIDNFYRLFVNAAKEETVNDSNAYNLLNQYKSGLKLATAYGNEYSKLSDEINGVTYELDDNPMGIKSIKLSFNNDGTGQLEYINTQGEKTIFFGMCKNVFGLFPQEGYSDEIGTIPVPNHYYQCAASAAWVEPHKLYVKVQIIDKYFGNLNMTFGFKQDYVSVYMEKHAEDFLNEYDEFATGRKKK